MEDKKYCKFCGEQIDKSSVVCPKCGRQLEIIKENKKDEINLLKEKITIQNFMNKHGSCGLC